MVLGLILSETERGERFKVTGSTSAKTGLAPVRLIANAVKVAVMGLVITSSPTPTPSERSASVIASVPEATPTACAVPTIDANSCSKASTSGPKTNQPLSITRVKASRISASSAACWMIRLTKGMGGMGWSDLSGTLAKVMIEVGAVELDGSTKTLAKADPRLPTELSLYLAEIIIEVTDVDALAFLWKRN